MENPVRSPEFRFTFFHLRKSQELAPGLLELCTNCVIGEMEYYLIYIMGCAKQDGTVPRPPPGGGGIIVAGDTSFSLTNQMPMSLTVLALIISKEVMKVLIELIAVNCK